MKEVIKVVLLDELKLRLSAYVGEAFGRTGVLG